MRTGYNVWVQSKNMLGRWNRPKRWAWFLLEMEADRAKRDLQNHNPAWIVQVLPPGQHMHVIHEYWSNEVGDV